MWLNGGQLACPLHQLHMAVALCQGNSRTKAVILCPRLVPGHALCIPGLAWWLQGTLGHLFAPGLPPLPCCWIGSSDENKTGVKFLATKILTFAFTSGVSRTTPSAFRTSFSLKSSGPDQM